MAAFVYRAVDAAGRSQRGVVEAPNAPAARRLLRERALLPVAVEAGGEARGAGPIALPRRRMGAGTLATVTRQLATLAGSGVAIEEALRLVAEQAEGTRTRALLLDLRGMILDGHGLAAALAAHPASFPAAYRASVAAGEASGRLADVLGHLARFVERRHRAQQSIRLALVYPVLLAIVSTAMIVMLMTYVVPDIARVFESHGTDLPLLTRALIGLSGFVRRFGWALLALLAAGGYAGARWLRVPANRLAFDRALATRRPAGRLVRQIAAARFAATLAQLVGSAVPLVDALGAAAAGLSNAHIRAAALRVRAQVREGGSLTRAMAEAEVFPPMLVAIVASGEGGGTLAPALDRAAEELDRELAALVALVVSLVEPAVLLLMGGIVLMMVLAILLPIVGLNDLVAR